MRCKLSPRGLLALQQREEKAFSGLIAERQLRHDQTATEVARSWGTQQTLGGLLIASGALFYLWRSSRKTAE